MRDDHAAQGGHGHLARSTADVDDQRANRLTNRQSGADRTGERLLDQVSAAGSRRPRRVHNRISLNLGDPAGNADDHVRPRPATGSDLADEMPQHLLGRLEVGDDTMAKRAARGDMCRRSTDHQPRLIANRLHLPAPLVDRDDRGLEQHDPLAATEDDRVRGTQIDR